MRDDHNFWVQTTPRVELDGLRVNDLLIPGRLEWDVELLEEIFVARDVAEIQSIPLSHSFAADQYVWHFTNSGEYTVKTRYHVLTQLLGVHSQLSQEGDWSTIWALKAPPQIKNFLWRMCRGVLPTKLQLQSKVIDVSASCFFFCANSLENVWHLFISCPFAISRWSQLKVSDLIDSMANTSKSLVEWFFKLIKTQNKEVIGKISVVLWAIWIQRNNWYWNGSHESTARTVYLALEFLFDWISIQESAKTVSQVIPSPVQQHWQRPLPGFVKCNIDAAVFREEGKSSWGIVVRDSQGLFLHAASRVVNGLFHVRELETLGLREALY